MRDPSCNGYLAWSAMVMAMLDGIRHRMDPGDPLDRDIYEMSKEELAGTNKTPGSLDEALRALDCDFCNDRQADPRPSFLIFLRPAIFFLPNS